MNTEKDLEYKQNLASIFWGLFSTLDSLTTSAVYTSYIKPSFTAVYNSTLAFILLPTYAIDAAASIFLSWYLAHIDRNTDGSLKTGKVVYATVTTVTAVAMIAAVIAQFIFTSLAPIFFAFNMGVNALYNIGAAFYYWGKSVATPEPVLTAPLLEGETPPINKKKIYRDRAIGHAIAGMLGTGLTIVAVIVIPLAKTIWAPIGTVLGAIGAALSVFSVIKSACTVLALHKEFKAKEKAEQMSIDRAQHTVVNTNDILKRLDCSVQQPSRKDTVTDVTDVTVNNENVASEIGHNSSLHTHQSNGDGASLVSRGLTASIGSC